MRAILLLGSPPTPEDYAARAYSPYALLSFAFNVFGTLPVNQSRTALLHENRYPGHPHHRHTQGRQPR